MSSVLAIISKAIFDKSPAAAASPGALWPLDRYLSKNKALQALGQDDALFLCTVRPGEQLWLVAVLEAPRFEDEQYRAQANSAPITDISALIPKLRLASGTGINAAPGKLAMSLQTPRALSAADVALLRAAFAPAESETQSATPPVDGAEAAQQHARPVRAGTASAKTGSTAKPAKTPKAPKSLNPLEPAALPSEQASPDDAATLERLQQASASLPEPLREALHALLPKAAKSPAKLVAGVKALLKSAGQTPHAVTLWDATAVEIYIHAKQTKAAADAHAAARALERKLSLPVDLDHALRYAALLARKGGVWTKELALLVKAVHKAKRKDLYPALLACSIELMRHTELPGEKLATAIQALGKAYLQQALEGWIRVAPSRLAAVEDAFWKATAPALATLLAEASKDLSLLDWALGFKPDTRRPAAWLSAMQQARLPELVVERRPERAALALESLLETAIQDSDEPAVLAVLEYAAKVLAPLLTAQGATVSVLAKRSEYDVERLLQPQVLDILLAAAVPLSFEGAERAFFNLYAWAHLPSASPGLRLEALAQNTLLAERFRQSLVEHLFNTGLANIAVRAAGSAIPGALDGLADLAERIADRGTLGSFVYHQAHFEALCEPAVLQACPRLAEALQGLDPVRLMCAQLQRGLMDEWGWPALDRAAETIAWPGRNWSGVFPNLVYIANDQLVVVGPEKVMLHRNLPGIGEEFKWLRRAVWVDGDVVLVAGDYHARWVLGGESAERADPSTLIDPLRPGGLLKPDGTRLRRGSFDFRSKRFAWDFFVDTECGYFREKDGSISRFAIGDEPDAPVQWLSPGWPEWMQSIVSEGHASSRHSEGIAAVERSVPESERMQTLLQGCKLDNESFLFPVPPRAERSPLGARQGIGGMLQVHGPRGERWVFGADGRRWQKQLPSAGWYAVQSIVSFPAREGQLLHLRGHSGHWLFDEEGLPLLAVDGDEAPRFWAGGPLRLPTRWWFNLEPRDLEASAALAACSNERARQLFEAIRFSPEQPEETDQRFEYADLQVTLKHSHDDDNLAESSPEGMEKMLELFPELTHPRLRAGVLRTVLLAHELALAIAELQAKVQLCREGSEQSTLRNADVSHLDGFFQADFGRPGRWGRDRLGQQIQDVGAFLFDDAPQAGRVMQPAASFVAWERLLVHGRELLLVLLSAALSEKLRGQVERLLRFWRETPFATRSGELRLLGLELAAVPFAGLDHDAPDRLVSWDAPFFLRCTQLGSTQRAYRFVALTRKGSGARLELPVGAKLLWEQSLEGALDAASIDEALALLESRGSLEPWPEAAKRLAEQTGLLVETASLLLAGAAWASWDAQLRRALGVKAKHEEVIRDELAVPELNLLMGSVVPQHLEELYRPLEKGSDGLSFVQRMAEAWVSKNGRRVPLALELVDKLRADLREPHPPFHQGLRALLEGEQWPMFTVDETWVVRPFRGFDASALGFGSVPGGWPQYHDEQPSGWARAWPSVSRAFSYEALSRFSKFVAWAYLELERGAPLRAGAARLAQLIRARLQAPGLLLPVAMGPIEDVQAFEAFLASFQGRPYVAADGGASASGVERDGVSLLWPEGERRDEGVMLLLRPSEVLKASEARHPSASVAFGHLGLSDERLQAAPLLPGVFPGERAKVFRYWSWMRLWSSSGWSRLLEALGAEGEGVFDANPLSSAPEAVAQLAQSLALSSDEAALYLMHRVLAEPTMARLQRYTGFEAQRLTTAAQTLVARGLLREARYPGTERELFLPEEHRFFDQYPAPVEQSKLEWLGLSEGERPLFGVPLPVAPLAEAYASVADGILA